MSKPQNIETLRATGQIASPPRPTDSILSRISTRLSDWYNPLPRWLAAHGVVVLPPKLVQEHMDAEIQKQLNDNRRDAAWRYFDPLKTKPLARPSEVGRTPHRILKRMRAAYSIPGVSIEIWWLDRDPIVKVRRKRFLVFTIRATIGAYDTGNEVLDNF